MRDNSNIVLSSIFVGFKHAPVTIRKLFKKAKQRVKELQAKVNDKANKLVDLSKESFETLSQFEVETSQMVTLVHKIRDDQVIYQFAKNVFKF